MKIRIVLILLLLPSLISAQRVIKPEWIDEDVAIFQHFFNYFPLNPTIKEDDLLNSLQRFKSAKKKSIGFGADLYRWILPGGTITIRSNVVSYRSKILMAETIIYKNEINRLSYLFQRNEAIKNKFFNFFKLQVNKNFFNDSVYINTYKNDSLFQKYRSQINKYLGKQKKVDLSKIEFEYNLLNQPTGDYYFSYYEDNFPPIVAIKKLIDENCTDCLLNIIKGNSLPGRIYAINAILQLAKDNKYQLTLQDKELIRKVLNMDLYLEVGYDLIDFTKYAYCIKEDLLKLLDE